MELTAEGYGIAACTELRTGKYSFDSNDFTVGRNTAPTVHGHSVLFMKLAK